MLAWNVTAIAFVVMVGGIGELAIGQFDGAMDAITGNGSAIRHQMQADQAHDALRAAARAAYPAFMERFHVLEKSMETLSGRIEAGSDDTRAAGGHAARAAAASRGRAPGPAMITM
jgi:hypothetical protein